MCSLNWIHDRAFCDMLFLIGRMTHYKSKQRNISERLQLQLHYAPWKPLPSPVTRLILVFSYHLIYTSPVSNSSPPPTWANVNTMLPL